MDILKIIINHWDPVDLLSHAPSDEYHSEIEEIWILLQKTKKLDALGDGIYVVFKSYFGETFTKTKEECANIASEILKFF